MRAGKSSLFRVIRKLWPLVSGTITMPDEKEIYFLTQVWHPGGTPREYPREYSREYPASTPVSTRVSTLRVPL